MNILIVGFGAMGQLIAQEAMRLGHAICNTIDPHYSSATSKELTAQLLNNCDVAIDFSHPGAVLENVQAYARSKSTVVMGTTGWYQHLDEVRSLLTNSSARFIWSPNFSLGVNIYFKIIEAAATLIGKTEEYDVWGYELHHHNKADSPSGTAKTLAQILLRCMPTKQEVVYDKLDRKIKPDELHFGSVRGGAVNFEHTVGFDSEADTITITHAARNRAGFALGAVRAAEWLVQQSPGFYGFDDFLEHQVR